MPFIVFRASAELVHSEDNGTDILQLPENIAGYGYIVSASIGYPYPTLPYILLPAQVMNGARGYSIQPRVRFAFYQRSHGGSL